MPKETYLNLPTEKRELIENIAIREFGENGYDMGSINRIVAAAGIAKGSFYQYFADKKDLYKFLIDQTVQKKIAYLSPIAFEPQSHDFFTLLRELFLSGLRFAMENPERAKMGEWLMKNPDSEIYKELEEGSQSKSSEFFLFMLKSAESKGEIREGLDLPVISDLLTDFSVSMYNAVYKKTGQAFLMDETILMQHVDAMIDLFKFGIKSLGGQNDD